MTKDIKIGDIVKFVPYVTRAGVMDSRWIDKPPMFNCIGLVVDRIGSDSIQSSGRNLVMIPSRNKIWVATSRIETIFSLEDNNEIK